MTCFPGVGVPMSRALISGWLLGWILAPIAAGQSSPNVDIPPQVPGKVSEFATGRSDNSKDSTPAPSAIPSDPGKSEKKFDPWPVEPLEDRLNLKPVAQLRGRIEAEGIVAAQSAESKAAIGQLQNGFGFRRIRLGAQGLVGDSSSWVSEVELAGGNVRIRDVFVGLDALPGLSQLRVGYFREPYSLEGMTSSNFITFLERSPLTVISPVRNWGICGFWWTEDKRLLFTTGAFRDGTASTGQSFGNDGNWASTTRLTGLPLYNPDADDFRLIHLGGAVSYRVPPNDLINFTPRDVSNLLTVEDNPGSPFLPALAIPASNYQLYNLQAAAVRGPASVQAEWSAAGVQLLNSKFLFVNGVYLSASYFLTGEHRGYNLTRGSFDQVEVLRPVIRTRTDPRGGYGAIELAARFSFLDLGSPNLPPDAMGVPQQTQLYQLTLGVNWYLNTYTRVMVNYTAGMPDKIGFSPTVAHLFGVRTAIYW